MIASPDQRAEVLRCVSSSVEDRDNPVAVVVSASPVLAWIEAAADEADLELRVEAMSQQRSNWLFQTPQDERSADLLLSGARTLYAFMTAGERS